MACVSADVLRAPGIIFGPRIAKGLRFPLEPKNCIKYSVFVTEVVANPAQDQAPEQPFVVPNNSAFHLLLENKGPGHVTVHQDGAFITALPNGQALLRTFRTPGRLSVLSAVKATVDVTVLGAESQ